MSEVLTEQIWYAKVDGICDKMVVFEKHVKDFNKISYTFQLWIILLSFHFFILILYAK